MFMMPCALVMSALAKPRRWQFFSSSGPIKSNADEIVRLNHRISSLEQDRDNKTEENLQMTKKVISHNHFDKIEIGLHTVMPKLGVPSNKRLLECAPTINIGLFNISKLFLKNTYHY